MRWELTGIWPLLNLYGSLSLFAAMSVAIFIVIAWRYNAWYAGGFVLAIAAIALAYGVTWNEGTMPAVPSLQSYWAKVHVPIVVSSYAAFLVAFVFSVIYLIKYYAEARIAATVSKVATCRNRHDHERAWRHAGPRSGSSGRKFARAVAATLPSLAQLDVIVYRAVAIGLPLISIGIITGAAWAKEAWGAYWQWDPKETAALCDLDRIPCLHASAHAQQLARAAHKLGQRARFRGRDLHLSRRQHLDQRPAQLQNVAGVRPLHWREMRFDEFGDALHRRLNRRRGRFDDAGIETMADVRVDD